MYIVPSNRWVVDKTKTDSPESMAETLIGKIGTNQEFLSIGFSNAEGFAEPVAFCDPRYADLLAAAPFMKAALETLMRFLAEDTDTSANANRINRPVAVGMAIAALKLTRPGS